MERTLEEFKQDVVNDFVVAYQRHSGDKNVQVSVDSFVNDFINDFARRSYLKEPDKQKEVKIELREYYDTQKVQKL